MLFPPCTVSDADDKAFNFPVDHGHGPPPYHRKISKTMSLGQGGGVTRILDGASRFSPDVARPTASSEPPLLGCMLRDTPHSSTQIINNRLYK